DIGRHQIHLTRLALVLLEGGDLAGIGRPDQDRGIGMFPAGIVGGVTEVFHTVGGQLGLLAGGDVAHPQVPVADKRFAVFVRREHAWLLVLFGGAAIGARQVTQVMFAALFYVQTSIVQA